jgi:orotate phosphoribosyltransferase-like protein
MRLNAKELSELLKLRALGYSQAEIADELNTSQQVIAYRLKRLKEEAKEKGNDEVFNAALLGGLLGATAGLGFYAILELLKKR